MQQLISKPIETRPAYVVAHPQHKAAHRAAQRAMFGAANRAGLPTSEPFRDLMLDGLNDALGLRGSRRLISRRQMTVEEMQAVAVAIEADLFSADWKWNHDFAISITPYVLRVFAVHIAPKGGEYRA